MVDQSYRWRILIQCSWRSVWLIREWGWEPDSSWPISLWLWITYVLGMGSPLPAWSSDALSGLIQLRLLALWSTLCLLRNCPLYLGWIISANQLLCFLPVNPQVDSASTPATWAIGAISKLCGENSLFSLMFGRPQHKYQTHYSVSTSTQGCQVRSSCRKVM